MEKKKIEPMGGLSGMEGAPPDPTIHGLPETSPEPPEPFTPVWISWDGPQTVEHRMHELRMKNPFLSEQLDSLPPGNYQQSLDDDYLHQSLDIVLSCIGLSAADIPQVTPLRYGTYELMVQISKRDQLREVFQNNAYDPFHEESRLVRVHGLKASIDIVVGCCNDMKSQDTRPGVEEWLHGRIIELRTQMRKAMG